MQATFWHWWILAGLCLLVEAFAPGFVFLWLGVSAGLTGLILLLVPGLPWQWQLIAFTALALLSVAAWLAWRRRHPAVEAGSTLNRRGEGYVGRIAVLDSALPPGGHARLRLGDTTWSAAGPAMPAGARVRIVAVSGTVLEVVPAD